MTDNREIARGLVNGWLPQPITAKAGVELAAAIEAALDAATERGRMQGWSADEATVERVARLRAVIAIRLNDRLCEMKEGYDDSITGFNEAWDIVRAVFDDLARAAIAAIPAPPAPEGE